MFIFTISFYKLLLPKTIEEEMSTHQKYSADSCLWQQKAFILLKLHPAAMSSVCPSGFLSVKVSGEEKMDMLKVNRIGLCEQLIVLGFATANWSFILITHRLYMGECEKQTLKSTPHLSHQF